MSLDAFWAAIDAQLEALKGAKTAADVIRILGGRHPDASNADAFFAGSGGDGSVYESLAEAGWSNVWFEAGYYWVMRAPDGTAITYVEGDVFVGNQVARRPAVEDEETEPASPCAHGHSWVAGMMHVSDEDVAEVAKMRRVECERCGQVEGG